MITPGKKKLAEEALEIYDPNGIAWRVIRDLLAEIDAHECKPIAVGISDKLDKRAQALLSSPGMSATFNEAEAIIQDILVELSDAGWIEGPPKELGACVYEAFNRVMYREWTADDIKSQDLSFINRHCRIPDYISPQEPVVDCCGWKAAIHRKDFDGEIRWAIAMSTKGWQIIEHCPGCGTKLPEKNDE